MKDPKERFTDRVENYIRYRPTYPKEILDPLRADCDLTPASVIADIGSGTGILSRLFLENGNAVIGVEPNQEMRRAGESYLQAYPRFTSVAASAEATTLPAASLDFITAGQAFHWFDRTLARVEFQRVLKPQGWTVLVWNERQKESSPFLAAYERLLSTYSTDYATNQHNTFDEAFLHEFFGTKDLNIQVFQNRQMFDFESLKGRLLSSSYAPQPGDENYAPMLVALNEIFTTYAVDGQVAFDYDTRLYYARFSNEKS